MGPPLGFATLIPSFQWALAILGNLGVRSTSSSKRVAGFASTQKVRGNAVRAFLDVQVLPSVF